MSPATSASRRRARRARQHDDLQHLRARRRAASRRPTPAARRPRALLARRRPPPAACRPAGARSGAAATARSCSRTPASRATTPSSARAATAGRSRTSAPPTACCVNGRAIRGAAGAAGRRPHRARLDRDRLRTRMTTLEPVSVALKFGFLAVLYLFLLWVVRSARRDLGAGAPRRRERRRRRAPIPPDATGLYSASALGSADDRRARAAPGRRARPRPRVRA